MKPSSLLLLAGGAIGTALLLRKKKPATLEPGIPDLPTLPQPPVAGYEHDDEEVWEGDGPPPGEDDYDDRLPCVTDEAIEDAPDAAAVSLLEGAEDGGCLLPAAIVPKKTTTVPDAAAPESGEAPTWPVRTANKRQVRVSYQDVRGKWHGRWGRRFAALRRKKGASSGGRRHAGVDLFADAGDAVLAAEPGEIVAMFPFTAGTWAVYVRSPDGTVINYGEVKKGSWKDFGRRVGDTVVAGDPLARVGAQTGGGAHMLHLEIYDADVTVEKIRKGGMQWPYGQDAPPELLDPTRYLLLAQRRWFEDHPEIT